MGVGILGVGILGCRDYGCRDFGLLGFWLSGLWVSGFWLSGFWGRPLIIIVLSLYDHIHKYCCILIIIFLTVRAKGAQYLWHGCSPTQRGKSRIWPPPDKTPHTSDNESVLNATKSSIPRGLPCHNNCVLEGLCMQPESFPKTIVLRNTPLLWVAIRKFGNLPPYFLIGLGMSPALQLLLWKGGNSKLKGRMQSVK